jgi:uncharacterized Zn finger protein
MNTITLECPSCGEPVVTDADLALNDDGTFSCHCSSCGNRWRHHNSPSHADESQA